MTGPVYDLTPAWQKNIADILDNRLPRKPYVTAWAERTGMSPRIAWNKFCTDDGFAAHFAKDPRRQNNHEQIASSWLCSMPGVSNFQKLFSKGPSALYASNGLALPSLQLANNDTPKSIDFSWDIVLPGGFKKLSFFAAHKYTFEDGGSQDNQLEDLRAFTKEASKLQKEMGHRFLALADGPYYQKPREHGLTHMHNLNRLTLQSDYVEAMTCAEIPLYIANCYEAMYQSLSDAQKALIKIEFDALVASILSYK